MVCSLALETLRIVSDLIVIELTSADLSLNVISNYIRTELAIRFFFTVYD